jgi:hypothetical protein
LPPTPRGRRSVRASAWAARPPGARARSSREALVALRGRHRVVEGGAVDLVAVVAPQALDTLAGHGR